VRIFLGTEPAQHRAERVFVWSIEKLRDPSRVYEIHLMKGLAGFDRRGWTTGFTNYRFAIPHFGERGRAIYNDVDQIYLADPALLFDLELGSHGYRAVAADDTSVMLLDCERMARVWTLPAAQTGKKDGLVRAAAQAPGLYGELDGGWNARDGEYREGSSKCLHFTNLHTQPWHPFPERFVYQHHPQEGLWHALERSADAAGFEVFTRERPSQLWRALEPGAALDRVPHEDLPWVLDERFASAGGALALAIDCDPPGGAPRGPDGTREPVRGAEWWARKLDAAAARHPGVRWEAELRTPGRPARWRSGGPPPDGMPPRVWVLTDDRPGNATQSLGLAEALGLPHEHKRLSFGRFAALHNRLLGASARGVVRAASDPLEPPWPDLVIAAGRRTAPVALWIREQSAGRTRLVQLGRKGADHAALFDLTITPTYCRLFPHPRRLELHGPLHRVSPERLAQAREQFRARLAELPAPRIAVLVGGSSGQYRLDAASARALGEAVAARARASGGSVLASTSRRTPDAAAQALRDALAGIPGRVYRPDDPGENPYLGFLAWADQLVITADSESMLMEAVSLGRPVEIFPLPERGSFRLLRAFREWVWRRAVAQPAGPRGTGRPQQGLELVCSRAIERGFVRPTRDLGRLHRDLAQLGAAQPFGAARDLPAPKALWEAPEVAQRVRALLGLRAERP
jgi:mitochondrial fission protein ELM1